MARPDGNAVLTVVAVAVVTAAAAYAVTAAYEWSHERIEANERARVVARLNSVLDPALRNRDLTTTRIAVTDAELLGSAEPIDVFVLTENGAPMAAVFAAVAPHGYNAAIDLLVGVSPAGVVTGVLLALARIAGETAPLLFTALSNQFFTADLGSPMASLPVTIFKFAMSPYENWQKLAWAGVFLITIGVLALNIVARVLFRNKV